MKPLEGIKVVELATYVAAPSTARMLADMGADVIKVEGLGGDQWREQGRVLCNTTDEENPYFDIYNVGKKSIAINIKNQSGKELLLKLIADADVFITNVRAKSLRKLGLDAETLRSRFPRLIYASVDGYGLQGPEAAKPGFDNLSFWARSGFMIDVPYKTENSYPVAAASGIGDCVSAGFLLSSISMALFKRERTGEGDFVNVSLYNAGIWVMSAMMVRADPRYNGHFPLSPLEGNPLSRNYQCADGEWLIISERAYDKDAPIMYRLLGVEKEMEALGINGKNYVEKAADVIPVLESAFRQKGSLEWEQEFRACDLVVERLTHIKDNLVSEQAWANNFVEHIVNRNGYVSTIACPPIRLASYQREQSVPAPLLGENTDEIMRGFGYSEEQIAEMKANAAIK